MHQQFLICASNEFVPSSGTLEANGIDLRVKTGKGATFPTPISYLSRRLSTRRKDLQSLRAFVRYLLCRRRCHRLTFAMPRCQLSLSSESPSARHALLASCHTFSC